MNGSMENLFKKLELLAPCNVNVVGGVCSMLITVVKCRQLDDAT